MDLKTTGQEIEFILNDGRTITVVHRGDYLDVRSGGLGQSLMVLPANANAVRVGVVTS